MSFLLYCIFRSAPQLELGLSTGSCGALVEVMRCGGISAAISHCAPPAPTAPEIAVLLAYEEVIESIFSRGTVIPMRYGCRVRHRSDLIALLEQGRRQYEKLLHRLDGLAEMSVQFGYGELATVSAGDSRLTKKKSWLGAGGSGAGYLQAQKLHYDGVDQADHYHRALVDSFCQSLAGRYAYRKVEHSKVQADSQNLYFLVSRNLVESFRQAAEKCCVPGAIPVRVTGPWPPYNFVDAAEAGENLLGQKPCNGERGTECKGASSMEWIP